jgi:hypothetical protein
MSPVNGWMAMSPSVSDAMVMSARGVGAPVARFSRTALLALADAALAGEREHVAIRRHFEADREFEAGAPRVEGQSVTASRS